MRRFIRYWLPVIAYCAIIFLQSSFQSPDQLPSFRFSDKMLHVVAYGVLAVLFCRAFNTVDRWRSRWRILFWLSVAAATAYGVSDEWHQSFVPGRSSEAADALADFLGSLAGSWLYLGYLHMRLKSDTP